MALSKGKKGKIDQGRINQILALVIDVSDDTLGVLINRLRQEQVRRNQANGDKHLDTIQT